MSLSADLVKLQRQRHDEIRHLHQTYLRTKRTVVRTASPARIVRRNMGVSLGLAATLGLLLAPRPSPRVSQPVPAPGASKTKGGIASHLGWLKKVVGHVSPQAAAFIPDAPRPDAETASTPTPPPAPAPSAKPSMLGRMLSMIVKEAGAIALSKIDFKKVMADVMQRVAQPHAEDHEEPTNASWEVPHPNVSVADAGTIKPQDYENFQ